MVYKYFDSSINEITEKLSKVLSSKEEINNAPYFLPYLTGERTPINDPHARASFHQMGIDSDRTSLIYALIEGILLASMTTIKPYQKLE